MKLFTAFFSSSGDNACYGWSENLYRDSAWSLEATIINGCIWATRRLALLGSNCRIEALRASDPDDANVGSYLWNIGLPGEPPGGTTRIWDPVDIAGGAQLPHEQKGNFKVHTPSNDPNVGPRLAASTDNGSKRSFVLRGCPDTQLDGNSFKPTIEYRADLNHFMTHLKEGGWGCRILDKTVDIKAATIEFPSAHMVTLNCTDHGYQDGDKVYINTKRATGLFLPRGYFNVYKVNDNQFMVGPGTKVPFAMTGVLLVQKIVYKFEDINIVTENGIGVRKTGGPAKKPHGRRSKPSRWYSRQIA